ncbi:hypothetical protein GAY31_17415 [Azospirillum brasilense]|nr:hypothetical protein [Azospirillum brasilense]
MDGLTRLDARMAAVKTDAGLSQSIDTVLRDRVSVMRFIPESEHAAIRAGTSAYDCTPAINAALATGKIVCMPAGRYDVFGELVMAAPGQALIGDGDGGHTNGDFGCGTIIRTLSPSANVVTVTATNAMVRDVRIVSAVSRTGGAHIALTGSANRSRIEGCTLIRYYLGVVMEAFATMDVTNCYFFDGTPGAGGAIEIRAGADVSLSHLVIDSAGGIYQPLFGIRIRNVADLVMTDLNVIQHGSDLLIDPVAGEVVTSVWATNCFFDTAVTGIDIIAQGGVVTRCKFDSCWAASHLGHGIRIRAVSGGAIDGLEICNPHVLLNATHGMRIEAGENIRVHGGLFGANAGNGIDITAGVRGFTLDKVRCGACGGVAANTGYGIFIADGPSDWYEIDADCRYNAGGSIYDGGTGNMKRVRSLAPGVRETLRVHGPDAGQAYLFERDAASGHLFVVNEQPGFGGYDFRARSLNGGLRSLVAMAEGGVDIGVPVSFAPFTLAELPPAAAYANKVVVVTNGASGKWLVRSNGTSWLYPDGTAV